jgi:hypothetical protein
MKPVLFLITILLAVLTGNRAANGIQETPSRPIVIEHSVNTRGAKDGERGQRCPTVHGYRDLESPLASMTIRSGWHSARRSLFALDWAQRRSIVRAAAYQFRPRPPTR